MSLKEVSSKGESMQRAISALALCWLLFTISGCTPRVEVAAPEKPITINLNVKIDHEVKVKVDKDLDEVLDEDSGLF